MASKIRDDGGCELLIGLAWLLKLEMMVDVDTATQGFMGSYQYIKNLGDGFGVKGRVGVWVVVQFLQPI